MVLSKCRQDYDTVINRRKEVSKVKLSGSETKRVAESHLKTPAPFRARFDCKYIHVTPGFPAEKSSFHVQIGCEQLQMQPVCAACYWPRVNYHLLTKGEGATLSSTQRRLDRARRK